MPSAFVSYAHEDLEFVQVLVERLQAHGLAVTYDQIVLEIGDSLVRRISEEIAEGDFLIAVVSPDSVESEWCQTELALAKTQGINERRVKVLPVRYRQAEMPPMLIGTFWGDADEENIETVALRLARAMQAHLDGRAEDADMEAQQAKDAGGEPAHAERPGDADVAAVDDVAINTLNVLEAWAGVWERRGNMRDIEDPQRRLRWALAKLPEGVALALPLVERLANADWEDANDDFLTSYESFEYVPKDIEGELHATRSQVAQGLPLTRRWSIDAAMGKVAVPRDADAYLWGIRRGDETARVTVYISRTAMLSDDDALPGEVSEAKRTSGRSVVVNLLSLDDPPPEVMVTTVGVSWPLVD